MTIRIPDSWLREFLKTKATPEQLRQWLSLCGPTVERIDKENGETIYTIEVTSNRPDSMSVAGIAREAAAILPRFGVKAAFINDPYNISSKEKLSGPNKLTIKTDPTLNPRFTAVVLEDVTVAPSPKWMQKQLAATGIRALNNVVDVTNWLMRAYGQPAHAFDYDKIKGATMIVRASKKGETLTTLDGKTHILPGDDIVIVDGAGRLIDLCGIMGCKNSAINEATTRVILFMQTYDPARIRRTSMALAHRTEAAGLFEKGIDSELVMPTVRKGIELLTELAGARVASKIYDLYASPYKPYTVSVSQKKIASYLGTKLPIREIASMLSPLGIVARAKGDTLTVTAPSFRRDITIGVDIIEEIARIYGYHNIAPTLPDSAPPISIPDATLVWERELKTRLRDWGYTELITYSMISEEQMDAFGLNKNEAYKIANPLSVDWVYMRPKLWPGLLAAVKQNATLKENLKVFELGMVYEYRKGNLPHERPALFVALTGHRFSEAKGLAEAIFDLFGIPFPEGAAQAKLPAHGWNDKVRLLLGNYGSVSELNDEPITIVSLYLDELVKNARPTHIYRPIPNHPPVIEDFTFVIQSNVAIGPLLKSLKKTHGLIADVALKDTYKDTRTVRVCFQDPGRNLTKEEIVPARKALVNTAKRLGATLKE